MERLTKTVNGVVTYIGTGNKLGKWMLPAELSRCQIRAVMKRLAAYEDTGMEPEDLKKAFNENAILKLAAQALNTTPDHLRDLLQAERAGRLVMLPCKVGDTLFDTYFGDIREKEVVSVGFMLSKSVKHMTIHANNFRGAITEIEMDRIGKDIFYTREAAEAALKGGEG